MLICCTMLICCIMLICCTMLICCITLICCTTPIILRKCLQSRSVPFSCALSCSYAIRRGNCTYPTRARKQLWWIISTVHCFWRRSNSSSSPCSRRDTPLTPRISADGSSSAVDLAATVQQLIDGSLRGIKEQLRRFVCPFPPVPHLLSVAHPRAATAERKGTYGQQAAAQANSGHATAHQPTEGAEVSRAGQGETAHRWR